MKVRCTARRDFEHGDGIARDFQFSTTTRDGKVLDPNVINGSLQLTVTGDLLANVQVGSEIDLPFGGVPAPAKG